ncbi:MAG: T9SS type A sorting domain-containing protein [Flavobacteriales bacterium]|nr:T9SS type A sorting domain-containing protein [Flavobacteriales bacterium]
MKLILTAILLSPAPLLAQTWIAPYLVGEYRNDVVYVGTYQSPGNCTWADGTDFTFNFQGIEFPTGIELALVVDEPDPSSTALMNGWQPVNAGDSTTFTPQTTGLGISAASGPATIHFHIRAVGTPTVEGEFYSCWIDQTVTEALCGNVYALLTGESFAPCEVELPTGINDTEIPTFTVLSQGGQLIVRSDVSGTLDLMDITGRVLHSQAVKRGETTVLHARSGIVIVRVSNSNETLVKKVFAY